MTVYARLCVHVLGCVRVEGSYGPAAASARAGKRAGSHVQWSEVCAMLCESLCECACEWRAGKCAVSCVQRTTGPDLPWCQETPCGAWLCGPAEEIFAKIAVIRAL